MPLGYFTDSTPLTPLRDPFNVLVDGINANETAITNAAAVRQIQTFRWANSTARAAQTGMQAGDTGYQVDTGVRYSFDGSSWKINTTGSILVARSSLSSVSSVNFDSVFLSPTARYRIVISATTSSSTTISGLLRASGSSATSSNYDSQYSVVSNTSTTNGQLLATSSWTLSPTSSIHHIEITLGWAAVAQATIGSVSSTAATNPMTTASTTSIVSRGLLHRLATAYDGISISCGAGTMTGLISIYELP